MDPAFWHNGYADRARPLLAASTRDQSALPFRRPLPFHPASHCSSAPRRGRQCSPGDRAGAFKSFAKTSATARAAHCTRAATRLSSATVAANARLMFVGEGPGADEDAQGMPFVGRAGQLLNNMIAAMGLKREEVYIANVVKCRPPRNRTPEPEEAIPARRFCFARSMWCARR